MSIGYNRRGSDVSRDAHAPGPMDAFPRAYHPCKCHLQLVLLGYRHSTAGDRMAVRLKLPIRMAFELLHFWYYGDGHIDTVCNLCVRVSRGSSNNKQRRTGIHSRPLALGSWHPESERAKCSGNPVHASKTAPCRGIRSSSCK
mgnify:CR=1 FL=1